MPKIPINPPEGFTAIEDMLNKLDYKMKEAINLPIQKKYSHNFHQIFRLNHQRSRYIYNCYYKDKSISKELYLYLLDNLYADRYLISYWKKQGYENLCCVLCIDNSCICRVPLHKIPHTELVECDSCGCRGCSGY
ncbi:G10 protein [Hamiltosporidium tvaerminnensis]|uniref:G10 protein n=1 Tax=Hamiltosporidium tvaerminnensis TaxID=1176355 RepID=A0A4Q9L912_9MICR|nr:G10 protein [Hamiltosporidium tvaerminnensis]TBU13604.1 G10 protein [Hamiltosporidium tvaerminnensis]